MTLQGTIAPRRLRSDLCLWGVKSLKVQLFEAISHFCRWRYRYRDMSFMAYSYLDNDIFLTSLNGTHLMLGEIRTNLVEHYQRSIQEYQR